MFSVRKPFVLLKGCLFFFYIKKVALSFSWLHLLSGDSDSAAQFERVCSASPPGEEWQCAGGLCSPALQIQSTPLAFLPPTSAHGVLSRVCQWKWGLLWGEEVLFTELYRHGWVGLQPGMGAWFPLFYQWGKVLPQAHLRHGGVPFLDPLGASSSDVGRHPWVNACLVMIASYSMWYAHCWIRLVCSMFNYYVKAKMSRDLRPPQRRWGWWCSSGQW